MFMAERRENRDRERKEKTSTAVHKRAVHYISVPFLFPNATTLVKPVLSAFRLGCRAGAGPLTHKALIHNAPPKITVLF
jgi:hypothetical protein